MNVCIAGTFNVLHKGHKVLLHKAFEIAGSTGMVYIGVTEGKMLMEKKHIVPFHKRINTITDYLHSQGYQHHYKIFSIQDKIGPAAYEPYDAIIVSPETHSNAEEINKVRKQHGKKPLQIIDVPHVLADDNKPISSTRILNKEIDEEGRTIT